MALMELHRASYAALVVELSGHMLGTTLVFVTLATAGWLAAAAIAVLHAIRPFGGLAYGILTVLEFGIFLADAGVLVAALVIGVRRLWIRHRSLAYETDAD